MRYASQSGLGLKSAQQSASAAHSTSSQLLVVRSSPSVTATQVLPTHARSSAHSLLAAQLSPRPPYRLPGCMPLLAGSHTLATHARPLRHSRRELQASPSPPAPGFAGSGAL